MTLLERLNDGGEVFLTHTTVGGSVVLRVAVGAPATTRAHVERLWTLLCESHDWLADDFAEQAAERAREQAARAAEAARRAADDAARAADGAQAPAASVDVTADAAAALPEVPAAQDETPAQAIAPQEPTTSPAGDE